MKKRFFYGIRALFCLMIAIGFLASEAQPNKTIVVQKTFSIQEPFDGIAYNFCLEENIDYEGVLHLQFHAIVFSDGTYHLNVNENYQGVTGTGLTSGCGYNFFNNYHRTENGNVGEVLTSFRKIKIITSDGDKFSGMQKSQITVNANGDLVVENVEIKEIECDD